MSSNETYRHLIDSPSRLTQAVPFTCSWLNSLSSSSHSAWKRCSDIVQPAPCCRGCWETVTSAQRPTAVARESGRAPLNRRPTRSLAPLNRRPTRCLALLPLYSDCSGQQHGSAVRDEWPQRAASRTSRPGRMVSALVNIYHRFNILKQSQSAGIT